jgi:hypothetical protein
VAVVLVAAVAEAGQAAGGLRHHPIIRKYRQVPKPGANCGLLCMGLGKCLSRVGVK